MQLFSVIICTAISIFCNVKCGWFNDTRPRFRSALTKYGLRTLPGKICFYLVVA